MILEMTVTTSQKHCQAVLAEQGSVGSQQCAADHAQAPLGHQLNPAFGSRLCLSPGSGVGSRSLYSAFSWDFLIFMVVKYFTVIFINSYQMCHKD